MSFRGGGSGSFRGRKNSGSGGRFGGRGGGNNGGRGRGGGFGHSGGRGKFNKFQFDEPPEEVKPFAHFTHPCGSDLVLKVDIENVPFFNAPVYLENKESIGKIDEIFGPIHNYFVSVKLTEQVKASSFKVDDKFFIDPNKLLPLARFLFQPSVKKGEGKRGGGVGVSRGGGFKRGGRGGGGGRNSFGRRGGGSNFRSGAGGRGGNRFSGGGNRGFNKR